MTSRLQQRRDTAANWTSNNPTLAAGEIGLETDTSKFKIGNGSTAWSSLGYANGITASTTDTFTNKTIDTAGPNTIKVNGTSLTAVTGSGSVVLATSPSVTGLSTDTITTSGNATIGGNLTVNGTTTTVNSTTLSVTDINIEIAKVGTPTDTTANGAGITIKGSTDKTFNWYSSTSALTSSENLDLASGKTYKINGTTVLSATAVGGQTIPSSAIVGLTDSQTLTNKTLTSPTINSATSNNLTLTGTLTANSSTGTSGYLLTSTGTGVQWAAAPISLPSQSTHAGQYLTTDGTNASWTAISVSSDPTPTVFMLMGA